MHRIQLTLNSKYRTTSTLLSGEKGAANGPINYFSSTYY